MYIIQLYTHSTTLNSRGGLGGSHTFLMEFYIVSLDWKSNATPKKRKKNFSSSPETKISPPPFLDTKPAPEQCTQYCIK